MPIHYNGDIALWERYLKKRLKEHIVITKDTIIQGKFSNILIEKNVVDKTMIIFIKKII